MCTSEMEFENRRPAQLSPIARIQQSETRKDVSATARVPWNEWAGPWFKSPLSPAVFVVGCDRSQRAMSGSTLGSIPNAGVDQ